MTKIKKYVKAIEEELSGAKHYAEMYTDYKVRNNTNWANRYKEMAQDELKHANYLHDRAVEEIEEIKRYYTPPVDMIEKWDNAHQKYIEKATSVKQILSL